MKKLSVISITFNNFKGLTKTLALFDKNDILDKIEFVIVDGGSTDETSAFLNKQSYTNNWVSEPDKGIYDAMNKGLEMATGEYVWFLNAGDYPYSNESIIAVLEALKDVPDCIYGETMLVDANGLEIGTRSDKTTRVMPSKLTWRSFMRGMTVGHQAFIIRKNLAVKYDIGLKHVADIDWMIKCLKRCKTIVNINKIIVCFTIDGHSTTHRKASNKERFKVLKAHYGPMSNLWSHFVILLRSIKNKTMV